MKILNEKSFVLDIVNTLLHKIYDDSLYPKLDWRFVIYRNAECLCCCVTARETDRQNELCVEVELDENLTMFILQSSYPGYR